MEMSGLGPSIPCQVSRQWCAFSCPHGPPAIRWLWLSDHAAVIPAMANNGDVWLGPFNPLPGQPPVVRFLLPPWAAGHSLALAQVDSNGAVYNTPLNITANIWIPDGEGGNYFPKAMATYDPSRTYWVADLTDRKKSTIGETDLRNVTWEPDYSQYPLVEAVCYLEGRELGHKYSVCSWVNSDQMIGASVTATPVPSSGPADGYLPPTWSTQGTFQVPPGSANLRFTVGEGMSFYIYRDADLISTSTFVANPSTSLNWSLFGIFPDPPNRQTTLQERLFRINAIRDGHTFSVQMSDGYSSHFGPSLYTTGTISDWNGEPLSNPLSVCQFYASIDPSKNWWLTDDTTGEQFPIGKTDVFDGWNPAFNQ